MKFRFVSCCAISLIACALLSGRAAAQGQSLGNGVYACDGAAQAGPCQPDVEADDSGGGTISVDQFGAHAVDSAWRRMFWTVGADSPDRARGQALAQCERATGGKCQSLGTFQNTCLAYAFDKGGNSDFVGYAESAKEAASIAMSECRDKGKGNGCYMMALPVCSGIQYRLSLANMRAKRASAEDVQDYASKIEASGR